MNKRGNIIGMIFLFTIILGIFFLGYQSILGTDLGYNQVGGFTGFFLRNFGIFFLFIALIAIWVRISSA